MITSQDIDRAFKKADIKLNQQINMAQFGFYKPDLELGMKLMQTRTRNMMRTENKNPLAGGEEWHLTDK